MLIREEKSKTTDQSFYIRKLEKEQIKSKISGKKEIIKIREKTNEIENRQAIKQHQQKQNLAF